MPAVRVLLSSSIFGPRAARHRSPWASGVLGGVEPVEEVDHLLQRLAVGARLLDPVDQRGVADADADEEAGAVLGRELGVAGGGLLGRVHPEVEDPGGDRRRGRGGEEVLDGGEHVAADVGDPQGAVPELLELGGCGCGGTGLAVAERGAPDAGAGQRSRHDGQPARPDLHSAPWGMMPSQR